VVEVETGSITTLQSLASFKIMCARFLIAMLAHSMLNDRNTIHHSNGRFSISFPYFNFNVPPSPTQCLILLKVNLSRCCLGLFSVNKLC